MNELDYQQETYYLLEHVSDKLDLMNQTLSVLTQYTIYLFGVTALGVALLACLVGFKIARGR